MPQPSRFTPALLFVGAQCGRAEEAITLYTSVFPNSSVDNIERYGVNEPPDAPGTIKHARFSLDGVQFVAQDSALGHPFTFTPAMSLLVRCRSEAEIDDVFARLADQGQVLMELARYPFAEKFAWINDRFGVSWQLMFEQSPA